MTEFPKFIQLIVADGQLLALDSKGAMWQRCRSTALGGEYEWRLYKVPMREVDFANWCKNYL